MERKNGITATATLARRWVRKTARNALSDAAVMINSVTRVYVNFARLNRRSSRSAFHMFGGAKFMRPMHLAAIAIAALGALFAMYVQATAQEALPSGPSTSAEAPDATNSGT